MRFFRLFVFSFVILTGLTSCAHAQPSGKDSRPAPDTVSSASLPKPEKAVKERLKGKKITITGTVVIYGNEPHTYAGIKTEDEKRVYAIYPENVELKVRNLQGYLCVFQAILLDKPAGEGSLYLQDGTVTILSWKTLD